jgi:hypothetical protein
MQAGAQIGKRANSCFDIDRVKVWQESLRCVA